MNQDEVDKVDTDLLDSDSELSGEDGLIDTSISRRISIKDRSTENELGARVKSASAIRSKLPVIPFSVLLPDAGNLKVLTSLRTSLKSRRDALRTETAESERESDRQYEEAMLNQVMQWLEQNNS